MVVLVHVLAIMALGIIKLDRIKQVFGMLMDGILIKTDNYCLRSACVEKLNVMPQGWDIKGCWLSKNLEWKLVMTPHRMGGLLVCLCQCFTSQSTMFQSCLINFLFSTPKTKQRIRCLA